MYRKEDPRPAIYLGPALGGKVPQRWRMAGRCLVSSVKHFVHQTLWTDVFHIHLERRLVEHWDGHDTSLLMELVFYAVVDKSNETRRYNDTRRDQYGKGKL